MAEDQSNASTEAAQASKNEKVQTHTFYAQKEGMTRYFDDQGNHVPVTVLKLMPNVVTQCKTVEQDGYNAIQLGYYEKREKLLSNGIKGHLKKAGVNQLFARFSEVRLKETPDAAALGQTVEIDDFAPNSYVDLTGTSKGKGFQGVMKRHGFSGGPAAHGSHFHRTGGSIGNRATPGRVFKQKKMPGHMGSETVTVQNVKVIEVNKEKGYMLVKGSVPGSKKSFLKVSKSVKKA